MTIQEVKKKVEGMKYLGQWVAYYDEIQDAHCRGGMSNGVSPQALRDFMWARHIGDAQWYYPFEADFEDCKKYIHKTLDFYQDKVEVLRGGDHGV